MDRDQLLSHVNKQVESLTTIVHTVVRTINSIIDTLNIILKNLPKSEENKEIQAQLDVMKDVLVSFLREPSSKQEMFAFNRTKKSRTKSRRKNSVRRGRKVRKSR